MTAAIEKRRSKSSAAPAVAAITVCAILLSAADGLAFSMVPMNLAEMSSAAQRIVIGTCTAREDGEQRVSPGNPSLRFTQYTFQITDNLKGTSGQTLTIRQVRLGPRPAPGSIGREVLPLPQYQPGQEVLLFLGADSSLGFTSPVAMDQAVFDVETRDGQKVLRNRFGNRPLFRNMSANQLGVTRGLASDEAAVFLVGEGEPIPYAPLVSLIRKLATER